MTCPYCSGEVELVGASAVYPHIPDAHTWPPRFICWPCDAHVGTHAGTNPPRPLGTLANARLRALRKQCHAIVDPFWKEKGSGRRNERRNAVYSILAEFMELERDDTHIGEWREKVCQDFLDRGEEFKNHIATFRPRR